MTRFLLLQAMVLVVVGVVADVPVTVAGGIFNLFLCVLVAEEQRNVRTY